MTAPAWRTVPMPTAVTTLPRTSSGMPVVYITDYVTEGEDYGTVEETDAGPVWRCACMFGKGNPKIGNQCYERQRQVMTERLCSVCGQPLDPGDTLFVGGARATSRLWTTVEGGSHPACAAYSARTCPRLANPEAMMVIASEYELRAHVAYGFTSGGEPLIRMARPDRPWRHAGVLMFYQVLMNVANIRVLPLAEWLAAEAPREGSEGWPETAPL